MSVNRRAGMLLPLVPMAAIGLAGCVYEAPPPPPRVVYQPAPVAAQPAPPPAVVEAPPPPPVAHPYWVWHPGHWRWDGYRWVWVRGHYAERARY